MLKTNQGTWGGVNLILRSSEYRPMRCLGRIGTTNERLRGNKNLDVNPQTGKSLSTSQFVIVAGKYGLGLNFLTPEIKKHQTETMITEREKTENH